MFQSTRPVRGATRAIAEDIDFNFVSIHAPRTGRDQCPDYSAGRRDRGFNPRAPYGARPET